MSKGFQKAVAFMLTVIMAMTFNLPSGSLGIFDLVKTVNAADITSKEPTGAGTAESPYKITSKEELYWFAEKVNSGSSEICAELKNNITVNENVLNDAGTLNTGKSFTPWTPIGYNNKFFSGTFNGGGHTISGLYFENSAENYVGLFGWVHNEGKVYNVKVADSYFSGKRYVGGVCGYNSYNSIIEGCYNAGTVIGTSENIGGVCGLNKSGGRIENCHNTGSVTVTGSATYVGGVCGYNTGYIDNNSAIAEIINCENAGTVTAEESTNVGGVCGYNYTNGKINTCYSTGDVKGKEYVGGVCGYNDTSTVEGCYNKGSVTGTSKYAGGVCGRNFPGTVKNCYNTGFVVGVEYVGGVCGDNTGNAKIEDCHNTGSINGTSEYVGGVCGKNDGTIQVCYSTGNVTSSSNYVGGVCGDNTKKIVNCYNTGSVAATSSSDVYVGGVCGYNTKIIVNCYNTGSVTASSDVFVGGVCGENYGSGDIANCYHNKTAGIEKTIGKARGDNYSVEAKTIDQFQSGEVAYFLSQGYTISSTTYGGDIWGQDLSKENSLPELNGKKVLADESEKSFANNIIIYSKKAYTDGKIGFDVSVLAEDDFTEWTAKFGDTEKAKHKGDNGLYNFEIPVAPKDMDKVFSVTGGGAISLNACIEDLEQSENQSTKELADAMLTYGECAKAYFNKTTVPTIAEISADLSEYAFAKGTMPEGISYYGSSVIMDSTATIRHYFVLDEGRNINDFTFTVGGKETSVGQAKATDKSGNSKNDCYYIEISGIKANNLDKAYAVTINENDAITNYRCLSYVKSVLENDASSDNAKNLVKALYNYYVNLKAYNESQSNQ